MKTKAGVVFVADESFLFMTRAKPWSTSDEWQLSWQHTVKPLVDNLLASVLTPASGWKPPSLGERAAGDYAAPALPADTGRCYLGECTPEAIDAAVAAHLDSFEETWAAFQSGVPDLAAFERRYRRAFTLDQPGDVRQLHHALLLIAMERYDEAVAVVDEVRARGGWHLNTGSGDVFDLLAEHLSTTRAAKSHASS